MNPRGLETIDMINMEEEPKTQHFNRGGRSMATVAYPHIELTPEGVAYVSGTTTKVVEIVLDRLAYHWDADEIRRQHPHLGLSQIYSALAYYYDHQAEMDKDIQDRLQRVQGIKASLGESPLRLKLRERGLIRMALPS
jgi:uncharacterized protein (DUF433 family)